MTTRLLLVAERGDARTAYLDILRELGVEVDCIASPDELNDVLSGGAYNGLLVDVPTMIRCECADKNRITRIMNLFPVLRLMYNPQFGGIRGLAQGGTVRDNRDLGEFVRDECMAFEARSVRLAARKNMVFNVLLLKDLDRETAERTITVDVSERGCFIYTVDRWNIASPAWMVINEFDDKTPIELKVRWSRGWGRIMCPPGIGASFESMSAGQYAQLHSYL